MEGYYHLMWHFHGGLLFPSPLPVGAVPKGDCEHPISQSHGVILLIPISPVPTGD